MCNNTKQYSVYNLNDGKVLGRVELREEDKILINGIINSNICIGGKEDLCNKLYREITLMLKQYEAGSCSVSDLGKALYKTKNVLYSVLNYT